MAGRVTRSNGQSAQHAQQQSRAKWTNGLTKILADLMVDEIQKGNRINNSFNQKAWNFMCDGFYQKTGLTWDKERLKSRYAVMRRQYAIVKLLLNRNEFRMEESTGAIIASSDAWAQFIKGHSDAESVKVSGCPFYKQLCLIFSDLVTNGKQDLSPEQVEETLPSVPFVEPLNISPRESSLETDEVDDATDDQDARIQPAIHAAIANRKRGRRGIDNAIAAGILQMAAASKLRTAAMKQINARYTIADCIKELDKMKGIEQEAYFAALDLFNNRNAREFFLSLKGDKQLTWLLSKCPGNPNVMG